MENQGGIALVAYFSALLVGLGAFNWPLYHYGWAQMDALLWWTMMVAVAAVWSPVWLRGVYRRRGTAYSRAMKWAWPMALAVGFAAWGCGLLGLLLLGWGGGEGVLNTRWLLIFGLHILAFLLGLRMWR